MPSEAVYLNVKGMHCSACAARIEKVVSKMDGVTHVAVNLTMETGSVIFDEKRTSIDEIITKVNGLGFGAFPHIKKRDKTDKLSEIRKLQWKFVFSLILTLPLAWAMLGHFQLAAFIYIPPLFTNPLFQFLITIPIQFIIGFQFYDGAWNAIKNKGTNMDVLVVLSTSAAFFYSHYVTFTTPNLLSATESKVLFFETSAFIITFILLGRLLEAKTKTRTVEALEKLYQVQTKTATLYKNGEEIQTSVKTLSPGQTIIVKPGEKVPIDGHVIEGNSMIDESLLTGESIPIEKSTGASVYAGTINQNGQLKIHVTKEESDTTLSKIIQVVEKAQASKAPIQHIADKITGIFVPIVLMIAIVTFFVWYFILQPGYFSGALGKVIAVLIVACPCALGLATPTSIMVGSGRATQYGILFKEGKFLELLGKSNYILLDKTGTITKGTPKVTDIFVSDMTQDQFLEKVGSVEQSSDHPLARAIFNKAKTEVGFLPEAKHVENIPGSGIKANVKGTDVTIASGSYYKINEIKIPKEVLHLETMLKQAGKTVMITYIDNRYAGVVAVSDEVKPTSFTAISRLKQMGFPIAIVTGDHHQSGINVARKMGVEEVYTECTPNDKVEIIQKLQRKGLKVVMVGDGINDAPALAVAHVGVAIGTGSDIAIESGDVTIAKEDLNRLVDAIHISKKTMTNIKQNFVWAFSYNIVMIPFAMFGILVPWFAGAAMAFSSISVVLNSLRLKREKINSQALRIGLSE